MSLYDLSAWVLINSTMSCQSNIVKIINNFLFKSTYFGKKIKSCKVQCVCVEHPSHPSTIYYMWQYKTYWWLGLGLCQISIFFALFSPSLSLICQVLSKGAGFRDIRPDTSAAGRAQWADRGWTAEGYAGGSRRPLGASAPNPGHLFEFEWQLLPAARWKQQSLSDPLLVQSAI